MEIKCPHCLKKIRLYVDKIQIDSHVEAIAVDENDVLEDHNQLKLIFNDLEKEKFLKKEVKN